MGRSRYARGGLLPEYRALQHERAPRPLPLFLELVRQFAEKHPDRARAVLSGLRAYECAERTERRPAKPEVARVLGASVRDHGGHGPPALLIPSLINPPDVLDLNPEVSLASAVAGMGRRVLLLDWGPADARSHLDVSGHIEDLLIPLISAIGSPPALIGYCLGGTMALAAANLVPCERVATLAAPWTFSRYPDSAREALERLWHQSEATGRALGALPMEVLQASFWSLDPERTVAKFEAFGGFAPGSPQARGFIALEDWANEGEPLPFPAARELIEDFFLADRPGRGEWVVAGRKITPQMNIPTLHLLAARDRIAPPESAPVGPSHAIAAGHVGMVVGAARTELHARLRSFLDPVLAADGCGG